MPNPKLIIELTENGAVVEIKGHYDFNNGKSTKKVFKFDEDSKEGLVEMLQEIDYFCFIDEGKYSKERVYISIEHGGGYECKDPEHCPICNKNMA